MVIDEREGRARAEEGGTLMIAREGDGAKTNVVAVCQESREVYALFGERESVASECSLFRSLSLQLSLLVIVICCCQSWLYLRALQQRQRRQQQQQWQQQQRQQHSVSGCKMWA